MTFLVLTISTIFVGTVFGNTLHQCSFYSNNFWHVTKNHFLLVNSLTVQVLQTEEHQYDLNQHTVTLLKRLSSLNLLVALRLQEKFLSRRDFPKHSFTNHTYSTTKQKFDPIDAKELYQLKRLSSDSSKGYFIIVWDVESLHNFLDENFQIIVPEARATYMIHFAFSSSTATCEIVRMQVSSVLKRFWVDYNVFNIIAQTSCFCDSEVYIYRPFVRRGGSWGVTNSYEMTEIVKNPRIVANPLINFNQFPLKIGIFPHPPTVIETLPKLLSDSPIYKNLSFSKGFAGVDGLVLGTLAEYLNFDITIVTSKPNSYGYIHKNGTATGAMADVIERRMVFSANSRFLLIYNTNELEFTVPYSAEKMCLAVPKALKVYKWSSIFRCFNKFTWVSIICTFGLCTLFWYVLKSERITTALSTVTKFLLGIPINVRPNVPQMLFLNSCMGFNIVVMGILQGFLFQSFTTTSFYPDIDTIEGMVESGLPLGSSIFYFLRIDNSSLILKLKSRTISPPPNVYDLVAFHRNIATTDITSHVDFMVRSKYLDEDGWPLIHTVDECFETFLIANIVPKGSAFLTVFNNIITKLLEGGLTQKWYEDVINSLILENWISLNRNKSKTHAFSLYDLQVAFYVIIMGCAASVLVFVAEILHNRHN